MPERGYTATDSYRYGFNGKENDKEVKGEGNTLDYGARIYDPRTGRFLSRDQYAILVPQYSPYLYAGNKPIAAIDRNGDIEVIVHVYTYGKDGKTIIGKYTNTFIIETVEDLKGVSRTPIVVNIQRKMTEKKSQLGNMTFYWEEPVVFSAAIEKGTGESQEDRMYKDADDKISKFFKGAVKFWPPAKIADAIGNGDRDPVTGEFRDPLKKYFQVTEGILDIITLGKGAMATNGLKKLGISYSKKLIDWGAEEVINIATKQLGLGSDKANILYYNVLKFSYQLKTGELNSLYKALETAIKLGHKGTDAINDLKNGGVNFDLPKDKDGAVRQAMDASGYKDTKIN